MNQPRVNPPQIGPLTEIFFGHFQINSRPLLLDRPGPVEYEYEYHFIEYEYDRSIDENVGNDKRPSHLHTDYPACRLSLDRLGDQRQIEMLFKSVF
jgi:hypothetical protein